MQALLLQSTTRAWRQQCSTHSRSLERLSTLINAARDEDGSPTPSGTPFLAASIIRTGDRGSNSILQHLAICASAPTLHHAHPHQQHRSLSTLGIGSMHSLAEPLGGSASAASQIVAASPLEAFASLPAPTQLSIQAWEVLHLGLALPWWASIPLTTLTLRLLLMPLTLKAKAASANFALWGSAFSTASSALAAQKDGPPVTVRTRLRAASTVYRYLRGKHRTPGTLWYVGNTMVQVPLFILMSVGLRRMCDLQWPGLGGEGLFALQDLTHPAVVASTWATPYGVFGLFLPLTILASYTAALQFNAAYKANSGAATALDVLALPYLLAAFISPQALLLYWLSNSTFHLGLQALLSKPQAAKALGIPMLLVHTRTAADAADKKALQAEELAAGAIAEKDPELLLLLADEQLASNCPAAAAATFRRVLQLQPGVPKALEGAALAHSMVQEPKEAAELYQQAAQQAAPPAAAASLYLLAASNFLAAAAPSQAATSSTSKSSPEPAAGQQPHAQEASSSSLQEAVVGSDAAPSPTTAAPRSSSGGLYSSRKAAHQAATTQSTSKFDLALLERARATASSAATQDPTHPHPHTLLALSHLLAGSPTAAAPYAVQALDLIVKAHSGSSSISAAAASADEDGSAAAGAGKAGEARGGAAAATAAWAGDVVGDTLSVSRRVVAALEGVAGAADVREQLQGLLPQVEAVGSES